MWIPNITSEKSETYELANCVENSKDNGSKEGSSKETWVNAIRNWLNIIMREGYLKIYEIIWWISLDHIKTLIKDEAYQREY